MVTRGFAVAEYSVSCWLGQGQTRDTDVDLTSPAGVDTCPARSPLAPNNITCFTHQTLGVMRKGSNEESGFGKYAEPMEYH